VLRHPEPCGVCTLGGPQHITGGCEGLLVRRLGCCGVTAGCSIRTKCGPGVCLRLASVLRVTTCTTHAAGSGSLNCHGRGPVPLSCGLSAASNMPIFAISRRRVVRVARDAPQRLSVGSLAPSSCSMLPRSLVCFSGSLNYHACTQLTLGTQTPPMHACPTLASAIFTCAPQNTYSCGMAGVRD
jgi:hypothetical protein